MVRPEDAWTGLAPHRAAKEDSVVMRSGLSPVAMSRAAAVSAPIPGAPRSAGLAWAQRWLISLSSSVISVVSAWYRRARMRRAFLA